jgi:predicted MFS family arabinose efflux permease
LHTIDSRTGRVVLTLAHVAGMIDLVALPLWVGSLMQHHGFSAPQAGLVVTAFLVAVALASLVLAPRLHRLPRGVNASAGFAIGAAAFLVVGLQATGTLTPTAMALWHALAGAGVGCALSLTHGRIGCSANPHRLFAIASAALGVFAVVFLAGVPQLIARIGPQALFGVFTGTLAVASVVAALAFPASAAASPAGPIPGASRLARPTLGAGLVVGAIICLTLNQAMVFSFVERIGIARGFGPERVQAVLIALGLVNLLPGVLAALLQTRLSPLAVGMAGPVLQAALALVLSSSGTYLPFAVAGALYVSVVIFTHTFLFGLLSRLDRSGRTVAGTPAMMMVGSCTGPALGGAVVQGLGYAGLGWVAAGIAAVAVLLLSQAWTHLRERPASALQARAEVLS